MFRLLMKVPRNVFVAVSGGPDSMAALDFLRRNHDVTILHFNHGTPHAAEAEAFVKQYASDHNIPIIVGHIQEERPPGTSKEDFWRQQRYKFFKYVSTGGTLVLAHTLDDSVETWMFYASHGKPRVIPSMRDNIIRPFLLAKKNDMLKWCQSKKVPYIKDPSNEDVSFPRVRLRREIIPNLLKVNPGLYKTVAKKYTRQESVNAQV